MKDYSNHELFEGIMGQNDDALNYLYFNFFKKVDSVLRKYGASEADSNDIFQETIILFYRKAKEGKVDPSTAILPYILHSCKLIWYNTYRKKNPSTSQLSENFTNYDQLYSDYLESKRKELYFKHFDKLDPSCKSILKAFFSGQSYRLISDLLGYKGEEYVKRKKQICKEYLIKRIKEDPEFNNLFDVENEGLL